MFHIAKSPFETIVVSALVLIFFSGSCADSKRESGFGAIHWNR